MRIALCEDEPEFAEILKKQIRTYFTNHNLPIQIDWYLSAEAFLGANVSCDILFTDIYMKDMNGLQLFQRLRERGESIPILFTTVSQDHAIDAFALGAVHYLVKPYSYEKTAQALDRCMEYLKRVPGRILEIKSGSATIPIPQDSILYIEVQDKLCTIHTEKNEYHTYASLDSIFGMLGNDDFMKAQRSYLVNMNYIKTFQPNRLVLKNGKEIVPSRKNRGELKKQYQEFLFALARKGEI